MVCTQIVDEIESLIESKQADHVNSLRFSYLVSQTTDLEVAQIDAFSACIESNAIADPKGVCIDIVTEFGEFVLFSN